MRRLSQHRNQRGFTLTEIMVAMAIFTIILVAALMLYDRSNRVFKSGVESAEMQQETRVAFDRLLRDVRMTGFDFDRDGTPILAGTSVWTANTAYQQGRVVIPPVSNGFSYVAQNGGTSGAGPVAWPTTAGNTVTDNTIVWRAQGAQYQQPDEQIEYAGLSAITIRGNLDYNTDVTNEHGRETAYEPAGGQFPIVTTGNDEIVTYALKSDAPGAPNNDTITFHADIRRPRAAYPGGNAESTVTIGGVDLCNDSATNPTCNNPPYTLYRFTIDATGVADNGTPVARNIRSLKFFYYSSPTGRPAELLTQPDGTPLVQGAIGGAGVYDPANVGGTTDYAHRDQRESIQGIRIELVGMNPAPDPGYTNPNEPLSAFRRYRTYELESLIVPRNVGIRGMQEPSNDRPTPPTMRSVCSGYCNATRVTWDSPISGEVIRYEIRYDTNATGNYTNVAANLPGDQLVGYINLPPLPAGYSTYYIKVRAVNEHGVTDSSNYLAGAPMNRTRPSPPSGLAATSTDLGTQQPNKVTLSWPRADTNVSPLNTLTCTGSGADTNGTTIPRQETIRYRVWRGTTADFNPTAGQGTLILSEATAPALQPEIFPTTTTVTWDDDTDSLGGPPANCKTYYYRIQAYDTCSLTAALNSPANASTGTSDVYPALDQPAIPGSAGYATEADEIPPVAPASLNIDEDATRCRFGPNLCQITLQWPKVVTDTAGHTVTIDRYHIARERKKASDTTWTAFDLSPSPLPYLENQSATAGTSITYTDTTAPDHDPVTREKYFYRYRVRAEHCGTHGDYTPWVYYPEGCPATELSSITADGATSGNGLTSATPWVMSSGDYVLVTPAASVALARVDFDLVTGSGTSVTSISDEASPYIFPWENLTDLEIYQLIITMTHESGCIEVETRYIQDQSGICPEATFSASGHAAGSGLLGDPYVMNSGDTINITPPAIGTISTATFTLFDATTNVAVGTASIDNTSPFNYTWSDRTDNTVYRLQVDVAYELGVCTETRNFYIKDEVCSGASVSAAGFSSGDGLTSGTPWVMGALDTVTVTRPATTTPQRVEFLLTPVNPVGTAEAVVTDTTAPFTFTWTNRTDLTVYRLDMTVVYSSGCQEVLTRYIKDEPPTCTLTVDNPDGTILQSVDDLILNLGLVNSATVDLTLQSIAITWVAPNQVNWDNVTFPSGGVYSVNSSTSGTVTLSLNPKPAQLLTTDVTIPASGSRTLTLNFSANGNRTIPTSNITKICVTYRRADTGTQNYVCRILNATAPDASANNPTTCD